MAKAWLMIRRCRVVLPAYFLPMGEVGRSLPKGVALVRAELGAQGRGRRGAEAVVARGIDAGVEGIHQLRDLVAAGGVDGVNVEAVVQHVLDDPLVLFGGG